MKDRYLLESEALPVVLDKYGAEALGALMKRRGEMLIRLMEMAMEDEPEPYVCPYKPEDFSFLPRIIMTDGQDPELFVLQINMPAPTACMECCRIYICHGGDKTKPAYFTVELTYDGGWMLCRWDSESHYNYGRSPGTEQEELAMVAALYEELTVEKRGEQP